MKAEIRICLCLLLLGCEKPAGPDALVITECPIQTNTQSRDLLDVRYPIGSRIVLVQVPYNAEKIQLLSRGLCAAGDPVAAYDGQSVLFSGKAKPSDDWQIYQASLVSGHPRRLTTIPGGAMQPAWLPDRRIVFVSPVPKVGPTNGDAQPTALYAQQPGSSPCRLTFAPGNASDPFVLSDGRIGLVYSPKTNSGPSAGLYTMNNDGTEIEALGCQHDQVGTIARPRALRDGRIAFLTGSLAAGCGTAECIRLARPFSSRAALLTNLDHKVSCVEPASDGGLLVCADDHRTSSAAQIKSAVYKTTGGSAELGLPLVADAGWTLIEAVQATTSARPMGRLSNMEPGKPTGQVLCLNANDSVYPAMTGTPEPAARIRVLAERAPGMSQVLGEVAVQSDGSFMAEVPADLPLGFEALDAQGRVLRRVDPMIWVRPGENRSCLGCHAAHNHAPHNHRPLAVRQPVPRLGAEPARIAKAP